MREPLKNGRATKLLANFTDRGTSCYSAITTDNGVGLNKASSLA